LKNNSYHISFLFFFLANDQWKR